MKTLKILFLLVVGHWSLWAQVNKDIIKEDTTKRQQVSLKSSSYNAVMPQILYPSPTSAVYQRHTALPPNLSTGTVNVNIPLYTLKVSGFELPFALNYQTSGIKLEDTSFPVGAGWTFIPGLRIVRTTMGAADDRYSAPIRNEFDLQNSDTKEDFEYLKSLVNSNSAMRADAQYDIYSIHLPNQGASFLMKKEGNDWKAVTTGNSLKIKPVISTRTGMFNGFEVTDDHGVIYEFGELSTANAYLNNAQYMEFNSEAASAWLLRKITLPGNNNIINLNWVEGANIQTFLLNDSYLIKDKIRTNYACQGIYTPSWEYDVYSQTGTNSMFLKNIQFSSGKIEIEYNSDKYMKSMKSYSKNSNSYSLVKDIQFNITSGNGGKRLLKDVFIDQEKYHFEYNEKYPFIGYNARDWWGYFNGNENISTAIPQTSFVLSAGVSGDTNLSTFIGSANRSIDEEKMKQNILTTVVYPTGGYSKYEYETHRFNGQFLKEGGGLRIKKIITKESDASAEITSEYRYGENESGLGICSMEPVPSSFFYEQDHLGETRTGGCTESYRQVNLMSNTKTSNYTNYNPVVWYNVVTEYKSEGKIIYKFEYSPDGFYSLQNHSIAVIPSDQTRCLINQYRNLFRQGPRMKYKEVQQKKSSGSYQKQLIEETKYTTLGDLILTGLNVERKIYFDEYEGGDYDLGGTYFNTHGSYTEHLKDALYIYKDYSVHIESDRILSQKKTYYTTNMDSVVEITNYNYINHNGIINLSSQTTHSSAGKVVSEEHLYPMDNLNMLNTEQKGPISKLIEQNRLTTPLVTINTNNSSKISQIDQYKDWGNNLLLPEKLYFQKDNGTQEARIIYNNYDSYGNPLFISKDDAEKVVYLWGYNYQYPIAEIKGATFDEVKNNLGIDPETLAASASPTMSYVDGLRAKLPNAMVTTYTYKPLVGIETATDPRGVKTTYVYDDFGRLKELRDHNNDIVETYDYHYKNQ